MRHDRWTHRLSEYLDGTLLETERAELARHLAGCAACTATLEELRAVVARARALGGLPPRVDLWPAIEARILTSGRRGRTPDLPRRPSSRPRRLLAAPPRLIAASIVLVATSAGGVWLAKRSVPAAPSAGPGAAAPAPPGAGAVAVTTLDASGEADAAVLELEHVLRENRERLDPSTVRVIETNLALIDQAIADARRALAEDPASTYVNMHLADTMKRKLRLLREATALVTRAL